MTGVTYNPAREALAYATRGIKIFPLWWPEGHGCACDEKEACGSPGKHPTTRRGVNEATDNPSHVAAWWRRWPQANIGLPAGANRLAIIDVDPGHGGDGTLANLDQYCATHGCDLMATRTVRTGSGGLHLIYRAPDGGIKTATNTFGAPGVDTRGRGGYVVAPPSMHVSGQHYQLIENGHGLAPWPAALTRLLEPAPPAPRPAPAVAATGTRKAAWALAGLQRECDALRAMTRPDSGRNQALNTAAYKVGRKLHCGLSETDAHAALVAAASGWTGHTPREIEATVRSGLAAGRKNPHPGPTTKAAQA